VVVMHFCSWLLVFFGFGDGYAKEMGGRGIVVVMHFCSWLLVFFGFGWQV